MPFSSVQPIRSALSRTRQFFLTGLWSAQIDALPKWKALPLFFVWVQTSWTLVLFGAELCYAFQNADTYCSATGCPLRPHERTCSLVEIYD
jgi:hypothetical protein